MRKLIAFVILAGLLGLIVGGVYVNRRNQMSFKDQAANAQWHQVDAFLQRRSDLIPSLLEAAKGSPGQEDGIAEINKAREELQAAQTPGERIAANADLENAVGRWLAGVEKDRSLESNETLQQLEDELAGTGNRIAVEARRYNELVQEYNAYIAVFPNSVFSRWAGFQPDGAFFPAARIADK
jgi:LemA protein